VCMYECIFVCIYICIYIYISARMYVHIYPPVQQLYFRATCDIAKRLSKIRVMENGQRNDIKCARIDGMDDT